MIFKVLTLFSCICLVGCGLFNPTTSTHDEGDEESGQQFSKNATYDMTRNGARLILNFDSPSSSFVGAVENTTSGTLSRVRVEVHLSNGTELGPTEPMDLNAGETIDVTLDASGENFETWSAHPEVGGGGSA